MIKGRLAWVFWLLVVLAVLTSTATYAWVAMNSSVMTSGFELTAISDSLYLEISADNQEAKTYHKQVSFGLDHYVHDEKSKELFFVTQGNLPELGGLQVAVFYMSEHMAPGYGNPDGTYNGTGEFFVRAKSDITNGSDSFINITEKLKVGDSLVGYYHVRDAGYATHAEAGVKYYYKHARGANTFDYVCVGEYAQGEYLPRHTYWGYSFSDTMGDPKPGSMLNIIDPDEENSEYCLKKTIYIRCSEGTGDAKKLRVQSVEVAGKKNYLTDTVRVYICARSDKGEVATALYDHGEPEAFNGELLTGVLGDAQEVITVDLYVYFDGTDEDAYYRLGFLTSHSVSVTFAIDDHNYN
ncbi:MAG: hypothetical protein IKA06_06415 [Clostridia bacterium]|nr:hypothetical protein [Clostridia bacterium]